jgi:hypothetical protein
MRVVVFVVMVGTRFGDSGGDGTLKSRPHTTPNGHRFGSAVGQPAAGGDVVGEVAEELPVVGEVAEVPEMPVVGEVAEVLEAPVVDEDTVVPDVGEDAVVSACSSLAFPCGVPIPSVNDAAQSARTLAVRTDLGCRRGRELSRIRRMRITPLVVRYPLSKERGT